VPSGSLPTLLPALGPEIVKFRASADGAERY
jgi:hypothetical protein